MGKFYHNASNEIIIEGPDGIVKLPLEEFVKLEPEYEGIPDGYKERLYVPQTEHRITGDDILPLFGSLVWEHGDRYISRIANFQYFQRDYEQENAEIQENIDKEIKKRLPHAESRRKEYPDIERLVVALWEFFIEAKNEEDSGIVNLQELRQAIKDKYPKNQ